MAKPGAPSRVGAAPRGRAATTRQALTDAAIDALKEEGFCGASARAIAERAQCNQALVFYHFGSVNQLLLAALDAVSAARAGRYEAALGHASSPAEVLDVASAVFNEDLDSGHVKVLAEMIAGASSTPGLGPEVARRLAPWEDFASRAVTEILAGSPLSALVPPAEAAHAIVALYLGLELLSHLDGDRGPALAVLQRARALIGGLGALGTSSAVSVSTQ